MGASAGAGSPRIVAHVDADAFFASVEIRDRPELAEKPVVVGGSPDGRGVVSTCNYVARKYGIRSAMPAAEARRLCPHAVFLRPDFPRYQEASRAMQAIFRSATDRIEPLSLDEAFLDLTHHGPGWEAAVHAMRAVKARIREEVGVTVSVGIARNKFLAKLASDWEKPDGFTVWNEEAAAGILRDLPVGKIWGVGPKTAAKLHARGWRTAGDLLRAGPRALVAALGSWGYELHALAQGIDHRPVESDRVLKSSGREETFDRDIRGRDACLAELSRLAEDVAADLRRAGLRGHTVTLKVKFADFRIVTRARTFEQPVSAAEPIYRAAAALLEKVPYERPIRLLGISLSRLVGPGDFVQPSLLAGDEDPHEALQAAVDRLQERYGPDAVRRARGFLGREGRNRAAGRAAGGERSETS